MFRRAVGVTVTEETEEFRGELRDGKPYNGMVVRRTVTKQLPPDTAAIIFYLKNRMPERYSDRRVNEVEVGGPAIASRANAMPHTSRTASFSMSRDRPVL